MAIIGVIVAVSLFFTDFLVDTWWFGSLGYELYFWQRADRLKRGYEDMLLVQERMMTLADNRATWGEIYEECLALAVDQGYADSFMGNKGAQVSFIGHGIGIEIDEYPFLARGFKEMTLETGMVFAFEPKVVFPGEGAIGIENTFYLTDHGLKPLTYSEQELGIL